MVGGDGAVCCAAGLRFAAEGFFSEAYLDAPVDALLSALRPAPVRREKIFEVTSLACRAPHLAGSFLRKIIACGEAAGFEWSFFTATAPLKALLERMRLPLLPLAEADSSRVANPQSWGSYYAFAPRVYAVHRDSIGFCLRREAGAVAMAEILNALRNGSRYRPGAVAMADDHSVLTGSELVTRVAGLAAVLRTLPQTIGLLGGNGTEWAVAQLAAWTAGKTVVPLPLFFSRLQLEHMMRDAGIGQVVATREAIDLAATLGIGITPASAQSHDSFPEPLEGAGVIVYTSGTTGRPKGVCLGLKQIDWQARALAKAIKPRPAIPTSRCCRSRCCWRPSLPSACRCSSGPGHNLLPAWLRQSAQAALRTCSRPSSAGDPPPRSSCRSSCRAGSANSRRAASARPTACVLSRWAAHACRRLWRRGPGISVSRSMRATASPSAAPSWRSIGPGDASPERSG